MAKVILNGKVVDFDACVNLMDDVVREHIHEGFFDRVNEQEFLDAYCKAHRQMLGEDFTI